MGSLYPDNPELPRVVPELLCDIFELELPHRLGVWGEVFSKTQQACSQGPSSRTPCCARATIRPSAPVPRASSPTSVSCESPASDGAPLMHVPHPLLNSIPITLFAGLSSKIHSPRPAPQIFQHLAAFHTNAPARTITSAPRTLASRPAFHCAAGRYSSTRRWLTTTTSSRGRTMMASGWRPKQAGR